MTFTHALATNNYGPAKFIVSAQAYEGTHTTIASAIAAASAGDTIFIRPGTYTENLTLKTGVNLTAFSPVANFFLPSPSAVIISGKCSYSSAGTVAISNIVLQTNSDYAVEVTGSAASVVVLQNCYINCTNNSGLHLTSTSASSIIECFYCSGDLTTTGIALFTNSGTGNLRFLYSAFGNSGVSTTNNTCSDTGGCFPNYSAWSNGTTMSSSSNMIGSHNDFTMSGNQTALTTSGTANVNLQYAQLTGGTSSAISLGAGTSMQLHYGMVSSSNANAIAGSGTLLYTEIGFNSSSGIQSTVVQSSNAMRVTYSIANSTLQPAFLATHSVAQNNVTGNGAQVTIDFTTEVFDQNSNYDGTNTFTAPLSGRYSLSMSLNINDAATAVQAFGIINTSNRGYVGIGTPLLITAAGFQLTLTVLADMDAGDTAIAQGLAQGLAGNTADFPATVTNTFFGGFLAC